MIELPVSTSAPMKISALPVQTDKPKRHFIAIGLDACVLVSYWGKKLNYDAFTQINDREISKCEVPVTFFKIDQADYIYSNSESMRFLIKEDLTIFPLPKEIISHIRGLEGVVVIYAGGDSVGPYSGRIYRTSFVHMPYGEED